MNNIQEFFNYVFQFIKIWIIIQPWETGLIVRNGKRIKKVEKGIYFKIPYFDSVFVQESRLRVVPLPIQTLTTKDLKTITLNGAIGYSILDIEILYNKLFHPETTIQNVVMSEIADILYKTSLEDISPIIIQNVVLKKLREEKYGINFEYFKITNFAVVKTFRLIQDHSWMDEGLKMDEAKK